MKIINTIADIPSVFVGGSFSLQKWEAYMDARIPGAKEICLADMRQTLDAGYTWENDFLPVLNAVAANPARCEEADRAFRGVTEHLDERIVKAFGRTVHADVCLYLGLCSGAGWVTEINGTTTVLLGLEKILELGWCGTADMTGLIIHELGHVYHDRYGQPDQPTEAPADRFLWQLFTEGIAMVFEQEVVVSNEYYHQDKDGWKNWCDAHAKQIRQSFDQDLDTMTSQTQRYFGDWVRFEGYGDTGYYLGTQFVRYLLRSADFNHVFQYNLAKVKEEYREFLRSPT